MTTRERKQSPLLIEMESGKPSHISFTLIESVSDRTRRPTHRLSYGGALLLKIGSHVLTFRYINLKETEKITK